MHRTPMEFYTALKVFSWETLVTRSSLHRHQHTLCSETWVLAITDISTLYVQFRYISPHHHRHQYTYVQFRNISPHHHRHQYTLCSVQKHESLPSQTSIHFMFSSETFVLTITDMNTLYVQFRNISPSDHRHYILYMISCLKVMCSFAWHPVSQQTLDWCWNWDPVSILCRFDILNW